MNVEFKNVGRKKRCWEQGCEWNESALTREVRKSGALLSSDIDVEIEGGIARIYADGRYAGQASIVNSVSLSA